jgi:hypothetical protein
MAETVIKKIQTRIKSLPKGKILFIKDFSTLGNDVVVRQSLKRLVEKEKLVKISQGIYYKPKKDKVLGPVKPSIENIAAAIAKRDKARIIPTGSYALYKLGLSDQVPMNIVYLTDGSPRVIKIGSRKITFKKTSPKNLAVEHKLSSMLIQGLKALGEKNTTDSVKQKLKSIIKQSKDIDEIKMSLLDAPIWIQNAMKPIIKEIENE